MKRLFLILAAALSLAACSKSDDNGGSTETNDYTIVASAKLSVAAEATDGAKSIKAEVAYNLKKGNTIVAEGIKATSSDAWVSVEEVNTSAVVLAIEPNPDERERVATLTLSKEGAASVYVRIIQAKRFISKQLFDITVTDITSDSATISALPKEAGNDTYYFDYIPQSTYALYGREKFLAEYVASLQKMIESNQSLGLQVTLADVLSRYPSTRTTKSASSLDDDTDYYAFAFDLDVNAKYSGNITLTEFRTPKAAPSSNVITINITQTGINVITTNSDPYVFHIIDKATWRTAADAQEAARGFVSAHKQYALDPLTNYIESGNVTYTSLDKFDITEGGEYVAYAFGYNKGITTDVTFVEFVIE